MELRLFVYQGEGRFRSLLPRFPGLPEALVMCLGDKVESHRFGDTMADPDDEMFWNITTASEIGTKLNCELDLVRLLAASEELSVEELEALARVCNAARLALDPEVDPAWELLTTVCSEATDALLDAA